MKKFDVRREFLKMEHITIEAEDEDDAIEKSQSIDVCDQWEPYWNQDEDWQYTADEIKDE